MSLCRAHAARTSRASSRPPAQPLPQRKSAVLSITLLILTVLLVARGAIWCVQKLHDWHGFGASFRRLMESGELGVEVYDGATWRTVKLFGKKRLTSRLSPEQQRAVRRRKHAARKAFLDACTPSFYQYIVIFLIASVLGLILETIYTFVMFGVLESRAGLVWGPFSPLYGAGAVLLTGVLWQVRKRPWWVVFVLSALLGGLLEQGTGWGMEHFMHAQSWTYLGLPDHITQWVAWRFIFAWGLIGLIWCRLIMPELMYRIGEPTTTRQMVVVTLLTVFMGLNILMTLMSFYRAGQRVHNIPPRNAFEVYVDTHFDDAFMSDKFENMKFGEDLPVANR